MLGISVSVSTVNLNKTLDQPDHGSNAGIRRGSPSVTRFPVEQTQNSNGGVRVPGRRTADDLWPSEESLSLASRRNSYSLMSLNRLRQLKYQRKILKTGKKSSVSRSRKTSTTSAHGQSRLGLRVPSLAPGSRQRLQISRIRETRETQEGEVDRASGSSRGDRPSVISRGSELSHVRRGSGSFQFHERPSEYEQNELPINLRDYSSEMEQEEDLPLETFAIRPSRSRKDEVSLLTRFAVALVSTVVVVFYCLVVGIILCEIELAYQGVMEGAQVPEPDLVMMQSLVSAISGFQDVENVTSLVSSLAQALTENGLSPALVKAVEPTPAFKISYGTAFYIVWTAITTVGYGNLAPVTWPGRLFTMIISTFGIPLFLINATHLANLMLCILSVLYNLLFRLGASHDSSFAVQMRTAQSKNTVQAANFPVNFIRFPMAIWFLAFSVTLAMAAIFYMYRAELGMFNITYFSYISLTTIGFGDITLNVGDSWVFCFIGPIAMTGIGLHAFLSEYLRFKYLFTANRILQICKKPLKNANRRKLTFL